MSEGQRTIDQAPAREVPSTGGTERVTVILPTYQRARLIDRPIRSVLAQTHRELELLVVDDGSTDDTEQVVRSFDDPRIRYLRQPENQGVSAARNRGLREATGEYIAFLDSDDEWLPRKLARQLERFRQTHPSVGLVYAGLATLRDGGVTVDVPVHRGDVYPLLLESNIILGGGSNVMIRRDVVERVGFFDEEIPAIEDYDYWLRIARHFHVDFVPEALVRYHDPGGRPRKSLALRENLDARAMFYEKHREAMEAHGTAHRFLQVSARRHLLGHAWRPREARRLCRQAIAYRPWDPRSWWLLLLSLLPLRLYRAGAAVRKVAAAS